MKTLLRRLLCLCLGLAFLTVLVRPQGGFELAEAGATTLAAWWTQDQVVTEVAVAPVADWALVPGTSIRGEKLRQRCETAAALYHAGKVKHLLLSGDARRANYDEPAAMRRQLQQLGVPAAAMREDRAGLSTFESVQKAAAIAREARWIIVTQATFAPRALLLAQGAGLQATAVLARSASAAEPATLTRREARATVRAFLDLMGGRLLTEQWEKAGEVRIIGMRVASL